MNQNTIPTAEQIATLAATLARNSAESADALCDKAMKLFDAASRLVEQRRPRTLTEQVAKSLDRPAIPSADETDFPMRWGDFMRKVLPQTAGRTATQGEVYRAYIRDSLMDARYAEAFGHTRKTRSQFAPSADTVNQILARDRARLMNRQEFEREALLFLRWWKTWSADRTSQLKSHAAQARWKKHRSNAAVQKSRSKGAKLPPLFDRHPN